VELNATDLRRRLLSLLENLPEEGITIIKRGKPVARLLPVKASSATKRYVTGPLLEGKGKPGPLCPTTENPYDLVFD
jgi:prevent-host-death family protein